ncbi:hypothetical protein CK203_110003 [Vitis vinifera]|uniref:Uncharacterized protein n=1 Tax=Vitis vinifera TaxID=29760 RepID=A0A438CT36_VITVI|nr:hypothetical protein CK203_110003 [Vitis vinifera]
MVTELPDSTKGVAKGHIVVSSPWVGSYEHPRNKKRDRLVEWVEKTSFDRLNKLFVISSSKRHHQTLLTDWNLLAVVWESQSFILPILSHLLPKVLEPDEHHTLRDLSFYEEVWAADAKVRQDRLEQREKKYQEGTLRQASGGSRSTTSSTALSLN